MTGPEPVALPLGDSRTPYHFAEFGQIFQRVLSFIICSISFAGSANSPSSV